MYIYTYMYVYWMQVDYPFIKQELAGKIVAVISVVSLTAGGLVHSNMYAVGAALCIIAASPLDR